MERECFDRLSPQRPPLSEQQVTANSLRGQAEQRGQVNPMGREAERVAVQTWRTYLHAALLAAGGGGDAAQPRHA